MNSNKELYKNIKKFWENKITDEKNHKSIRDDELETANWLEQLQKLRSVKLIEVFSNKIRREIRKSYNAKQLTFLTRILETPDSLSPEEKNEIYKAAYLDGKNFEIKVGGDEFSKTQKDNLIKEKEQEIEKYETGLKKIVGDDLTGWETKIVKSGSGDEDIQNLRDQITGLTNEKKDLEKQVQQKTDQWNNHKCDTPNNAELNQIKDELSKMTQERNKLQGQLNQPNSNQPVPIIPPPDWQ